MRTASLSLVLLPLAIITLAGLGLLQAFLSKKENETLGLILPTSSFVLSVFLLLALDMFNSGAADTFVLYILGIAWGFFILNIPTIVYLVIFSACRKKYKAKKEIEKMNIMDLE